MYQTWAQNIDIFDVSFDSKYMVYRKSSVIVSKSMGASLILLFTSQIGSRAWRIGSSIYSINLLEVSWIRKCYFC